MVSALFRSAVAFSAVGFSIQSDCAQGDWKLRQARDGIEVFSRPVPGSPFDAVRAVMRVDASLHAVVALLRDPAARPQWDTSCTSAELEQSGETEETVHLVYDLPWPVADRDLVVKTAWSQDASTKAVVMKASAIDDAADAPSGRVRVRHAQNMWTLTPLGDGTIEVSAETHLDPEGPLPSWLLNRLAIDAPIESLGQIRKMVTDERYANAHVSFIR